MYSVVCNVRIYCLDTVYCRQYTIHATLIHLAYHDNETPVYDVIEIEGCNSNFRREDLSQGHSLLMHYDRYTMIALVSSKHLPIYPPYTPLTYTSLAYLPIHLYTGIEIVERACRSPIRTICNNAGFEGSVIVGEMVSIVCM